MSESGPIAEAWTRVRRVADEECPPVDKRESLARALIVLREAIRKVPQAETELQRRARWVAEHVGPGSELPRLIDRIVKAIGRTRDLRPHEQLAVETLRETSRRSIDSLQQLEGIKRDLRWLSGRADGIADIGKANDLVDTLLNASVGNDVAAAAALVETTELKFDTQVKVFGNDASGVSIVESVPLDGVGQLALWLDKLPTTPRLEFNDVVSANRPRCLYAKLREHAGRAVSWNNLPEEAFRDRNNINDDIIFDGLTDLRDILNHDGNRFGTLSISKKNRTATLKLSPEK